MRRRRAMTQMARDRSAGRGARADGLPTVPLLLAGVLALVHLVSNLFRSYGYFRDEFYYLVCGDRLAFGYVDHPPLIAVVARVTRTLLGDSLVAIRIPPLLAGAAIVVLTGLMARDLGGGRWAQGVAGLAVVAAPVYLATQNFLSTISLDQLCWAACGLFAVRLLATGDRRYWLGIGAALGIGLETKNNITFLVIAVVVGTLLTANRRDLRSRWLWLGALLAAGIAAPNIVWEIAHGWPTLEFSRNAAFGKNQHVGPLAFLGTQIGVMNPVALPLWLSGLVFFCRTPRYRMLAFLWLVPFALLAATQAARVDYLAPAYPLLFAGGAVAIERWIARGARRAWVRPAYPAAIALVGLLMLPLMIPVLSPSAAESLFARLSGAGARDPSLEQGKTAALPQYFADQFGWPELAAEVARVYQALPPDRQANAVIFTANYGEAGAITFFGGAYHLPPVISGHNNYYLWGPGPATAQSTFIVVGETRAQLQPFFAETTEAGRTACAHCMDYENHQPIFVARQPTGPLAEIWPRVKHYT
jgi:4-amino-4-deoxy-L-arabinose transferase-like glycosyltransferase